jgi:hypothetical protein
MQNSMSLRHLGASTETVFDRWLATARHGMFGVLFTMAKDMSGHTKWSIFGLIYDGLQLLAYALYSGKSFPWKNMKNMSWLLALLTYINPSNAADGVSPLLKVSLLLLACCWVAATVLVVIWAAYSFSVGNFSTVAPLKFLRATARLTATALFVPFATLLISAYKCKEGGHWSVTDWECYGTEHSLIMLLVSILLPCFWAFTLCVSAVFFDKDMSSNNITAKAHGRVALLMISIKTALTLVFTVAADVNPWFLHIVVLGSGIVWLYLFLRFLPFYNQRMNQAWSASASIFLWGAICAILAKVLNDPESGVAGYVFYIGSPTAAYAGYALAFMRFERLSGRQQSGAILLKTPKTPWDVELRVRYLLRDIIETAQKAHGHGHGHIHQSARVTPAAPHPHRSSMTTVTTYNGASGATSHGAAYGVGVGSNVGGMGGNIGQGEERGVTLFAAAGSQETSGWQGTTFSFQAPHHLQEEHAHGTHVALHVSPAMDEESARQNALIQECYDIYCNARATLFPQSAVLDLFFANFVRSFMHDDDLELSIISEGLEKDPSVDIRFLLFQAKRQLDESPTDASTAAAGHTHIASPSSPGAAGNGKHAAKMTIIERVQYEQFLNESLEACNKARHSELAFWSELRKKVPELSKLHAASETMNTAINKATAAYEKLLAMRSDSVEVLQSYAVFLLEVKRETAAANKYFDQADELLSQLEESNNKHATPHGHRNGSVATLVVDTTVARKPSVLTYPAGSPSSFFASSYASPSNISVSDGPLSRGASQFSPSSPPTNTVKPTRHTPLALALHGPGRRGSAGSIVSMGSSSQYPSRMSSQALSSAAAEGSGADHFIRHQSSAAAAPMSTGSHHSLRSSVPGGEPHAPRRLPSRISATDVSVSHATAGDDPLIKTRNKKDTAAMVAYAASVLRKRRESRTGSLTDVTGSGKGRSGKHLIKQQQTQQPHAQQTHVPMVRHKSLKEIIEEQVGPSATHEEALLTSREEGRTRTLQHVTQAARKEAQRLHVDATEAAASSLRMTIKAKARIMEPSLVLLTRVLVAIFLLGASLDILGVSVHRYFTGLYEGSGGMVVTAAIRMKAAEDVLRETYLLTRMHAGLVGFTPAQLNRTYINLKTASAIFDAAQHDLYQHTSASYPDEMALYSTSSFPVYDLTVTPSGGRSVSSREVSLPNLALEYASKATQVITLPFENATESHPVLYYILRNGPLALRDALNSSQWAIADRLEVQYTQLKLLDASLVITGVVLFTLLSVLALLPVVRQVKSHTDDIFTIFLHLPDDVLHHMETTCRDQLNRLRALAEDPNALALGSARGDMGTMTVTGRGGGTTGRVTSDMPGVHPTHTHTYAHVAAADEHVSILDTNENEREEGSSIVQELPRVTTAMHLMHPRDANERRGLARVLSAQLLPEIGAAGVKTRAPKAIKHSIAMQLKLLVRFAWPFVVLAVYFVAVWGYQSSVLSSLLSKQQHTFMLGEVISLLASTNNDMSMSLLDAPPLIPVYSMGGTPLCCNASGIGEALERFDTTSAMINSVEDALLYGDIQLGITSLIAGDGGLTSIMLENGCAVPGMPEDCAPHHEGTTITPPLPWAENDDAHSEETYTTGFYHGLLTDGLQAAMREYLLAGRRAFQTRLVELAQAGGGAGCPPADTDIGSPSYTLVILGSKYILPAFTQVLLRVRKDVASIVSAYSIGHGALTAISLLYLILIYAFYLGRNIKKMDGDMKRTRGTLLLFPTDVLAEVAQLVNLVEEEGSAVMGSSFIIGRTGAEEDNFAAASTNPVATYTPATPPRRQDAFASVHGQGHRESRSRNAGWDGERRGHERKWDGKRASSLPPAPRH